MNKKKIIENIKPIVDLKIKLETKFYEQLDESQYPKYLAKLYKKTTGQILEWDNLRTYTEKMQWAKLYDKDPLKTELSDKYRVREWVKNIIGEEYLIPLLGVWDQFDDIDFSKLPTQFVLKTNHASDTNYFIEDKKTIDYKKCRNFFEKVLKINKALISGFELHYKDINPKIIAEKFMEDSNGELNDYRFMCFDGKAYYCMVDIPQNDNTKKRNIYDLNWNLQNWRQGPRSRDETGIKKPKNYELMISIAEKLSENFSHVRVDLYNLDGKIFFGEMTFTGTSGFQLIYPHSVNQMLGELWKIPN